MGPLLTTKRLHWQPLRTDTHKTFFDGGGGGGGEGQDTWPENDTLVRLFESPLNGYSGSSALKSESKDGSQPPKESHRSHRHRHGRA